MRGEHCGWSCHCVDVGGSAPRARGTHTANMVGDALTRISPACAGNTQAGHGRFGLCTDQPRVRGEHSPDPVRLATRTGSAPRARGTPLSAMHRSRLTRISPACAGNTAAACSRSELKPDQPRVRGEHCDMHGLQCNVVGSAPRARGTRGPPTGDHPRHRISPACAGNTRRPAARRRSPADQPRVRGEHHNTQVLPRLDQRISPACAGNT